MAIEPARKCGYRKVGGLYLVGGVLSAPCDRLPFLLDICPCCGSGIKQAQTWITPAKLFGPAHWIETEITPSDSDVPVKNCACSLWCPMCHSKQIFWDDSKATLLWVGAKHYSPAEFLQEGAELGVSKRINTIPRDFEIGKTWVFFAHPDAIEMKAIDAFPEAVEEGEGFAPDDLVDMPGIICVIKPSRIERIVKQSKYDDWHAVDSAERLNGQGFMYVGDQQEHYQKLQRDVDRGITLVPVPDDDPDHMGCILELFL